MRLAHGLNLAGAREHLRVLSPRAAVESVEIAALDLLARCAAREPHPRSGPQPRCEACSCFKGQAHAPCGHCGYTPGQGYAA